MRYLVVAFAVIALAACSQDKTADKPNTAPPSSYDTEVDLQPSGNTEATSPKDVTSPKQVATFDEPIALPAPATGLVFWDHPSLPYEGLVIAATGEGVFAHTLEGTEPVNQIPGINASGAQLAYLQASTDDDAAVAVFSTYDATNKAFRFFQIDNVTQDFNENLLSIPYKDDYTAWCLGSSPPSSTLFLTIIVADTLHHVKISRAQENTYTVDQSEPRKLPASIIDCAFDPVTGQFFGLSDDGYVLALNTEAINKPVINSVVARPYKLSISNYLLGSDNNAASIETKFLLLDRATSHVQIYDAQTGNLDGVIELEKFNEIEGVDNASTFALGTGNYGGVYRFGVLALANSGTKAAVRLTSYLAAARAVNTQVDGPFSIRKWMAQEEPTGETRFPELLIDPELSIDLKVPTP